MAHWPTARTTQLTYSRCDPQNISFRQPTGRPPDAEIAQKAHRALQGPSLFAAAHESVVASDCFRRFAAIICSWLRAEVKMPKRTDPFQSNADDHFKVSVVSSDPKITAARASLKARDEISPKTRRSRHYGVELPWLLSPCGENK
jgi:hypothetical protein